MPGSSTTPGLTGTCVDAPVNVAFRSEYSVGTWDNTLSRLHGWPMRSPTDASPLASRPTVHGSGPMWIAIPYIVTDFHHLLLAGLPAHTQ